MTYHLSVFLNKEVDFNKVIDDDTPEFLSTINRRFENIGTLGLVNTWLYTVFLQYNIRPFKKTY